MLTSSYKPRIVRELSKNTKNIDKVLSNRLAELYGIKKGSQLITNIREELARYMTSKHPLSAVIRKDTEDFQQYEELLPPDRVSQLLNLLKDVYYHSLEFIVIEDKSYYLPDTQQEILVSGIGWILAERQNKRFIAVHGSIIPNAPLKFITELYEIIHVDFHYEEANRFISFEVEYIDAKLLQLMGGSPIINIPKNISTNLLHFTRPGQPTLYEQIEDRNLAEKVRKVREEGNIVIEGIKLTVPEDRLLKAIYKLINKNKVQYIQKVDERSGRTIEQEAIIKTTWSEIYEAYDLEKKQKKKQYDYPSSDVETVQRALDNLARKKFLMTYKAKEGTLITYGSLLDVEIFLESDNRTKPKIALRLNKIIYEQIDKDYIKVPSDIHKQIEIVTGGQRVQPSTVSFINYLLDILRPAQLNNNNLNIIDYQTLAYITGLEDCLDRSRKKRFSNRLKEMFTVAIQIGIAHSIVEQKGKENQLQAVIELNLDYVK